MSNRNKRMIYAAAALLLFLAECLISRTSGFLRYTVGDLLVVMLIYAGMRVILPNIPSPLILSVCVLLFAVCVELSQYFNLIGWLGLGGERLAHLTIGSTFDWGDLAAYLIGCVLSFGADTLFRRNA